MRDFAYLRRGAPARPVVQLLIQFSTYFLHMRSIALVLFMALVGHSSASHGQTTATVDQFLNGFLAMSKTQCSRSGTDSLAKQYEDQGRKAEAHSMRSAEKSVCSCMPERVRWLQSTLTKEERSTKLSEAEFTKKFLPEIANKCAADQQRSTYGDGCADRLAKFRPNTEAYCSCMTSRLSELSDAELAQAGTDSADYAPRAAEAKRQGVSLPEQPPALKRMAAIDSSCAKK
jgi:hypothetical protein